MRGFASRRDLGEMQDAALWVVDGGEVGGLAVPYRAEGNFVSGLGGAFFEGSFSVYSSCLGRCTRCLVVLPAYVHA